MRQKKAVRRKTQIIQEIHAEPDGRLSQSLQTFSEAMLNKTAKHSVSGYQFVTCYICRARGSALAGRAAARRPPRAHLGRADSGEPPASTMAAPGAGSAAAARAR